MNVYGFLIRVVLSLVLGLLYALMMMPFFGWSPIGLLFGPVFLFCFEIVISLIVDKEEKKYIEFEKTFIENVLYQYECMTRSRPIMKGQLYLFKDHLVFASLEKKPFVTVEMEYKDLKQLVLNERGEVVINNFAFVSKNSHMIYNHLNEWMKTQR